jgi:hypothetical protein
MVKLIEAAIVGGGDMGVWMRIRRVMPSKEVMEEASVVVGERGVVMTEDLPLGVRGGEEVFDDALEDKFAVCYEEGGEV